MANRGSVLLVSGNPELHRILELVASTYNLSCMGTENVREGVGFLRSNEPDCIVFDLNIVSNHKQRSIVKKKLEEKDVPVLFLNENGNGTPSRNHAPLKIEPIVKFVMDSCDGACRLSKGGLGRRLLGLLRLRRRG
ncbi:MAG: hypothetical protein C4532_14515 [Candidatus Abyssobacteria bacterium SURF_17]|jgi:glutaredoxin|uniref:Response regulator n=1 Tax=Candidatus Abyssobacteria bacterium SURF_17 TaxID=2093361 RepID=A0A419ETY3_9BACT|nr:MAG: hypothetical protein C4532_14515 [Candidatus Abyssubacteria bacterium SURF_17]